MEPNNSTPVGGVNSAAVTALSCVGGRDLQLFYIDFWNVSNLTFQKLSLSVRTATNAVTMWTTGGTITMAHFF